MGLPVEVNNLMMGSLGGYTIGRSLRLRSSASAYLTRTPASAGNRTTWTYSIWTKKASNSGYQSLLDVGGSGNGPFRFYNSGANATDTKVQFYNYNGSYFDFNVESLATFRDPSAWYHIVLVFDSTNATASNRIKLYINGVQQTLQASTKNVGSDRGFPDQNFAGQINNAIQQRIGADPGSFFYDGYIAEVNFIDGQALTPSSFGAYDTNGVWQPKKYTGTYGTNGFYLPFNWSSSTSFAGSFNGSTQYLTVPTNTAFDMGAGDFTLEAWVLTDTTTNRNIVAREYNGNASNYTTFVWSTTQFVASTSATAWDVNFTWSLPSANQWHHYALVRNGNVYSVYIDGIRVGTQTVAGTLINGFGSALTIGYRNGQSLPSGSLSNVRIVKGTAVYTANFTPPTSALTAISGTSLLTLQSSTIIDNSTNGFTITNVGSVAMAASSPFGASVTADASGNNNGWASNNINYSAYGTTFDSMIDSPTVGASASNYAVLNPLRTASSSTVSNGNLTFTDSTNNHNYLSTIGMSSGKWYFEFVAGATGFSAAHAGIALSTVSPDTYIGSDTNGYSYHATTGQVLYNNSALGTYSTWTGGDVIGVAFDATSGKLYVAKNNTWQNSGNPAAGTGAVATGIASNTWFFGIGGNPSSTLNANFGQQPFTYTPPTGFNALNTYNLPAPSIANGAQYMAATTYAGTGNANGDTLTVSNGNNNTLGTTFQPDLVWVKTRDGSGGTATNLTHILADSLRGTSNLINSNTTNAEYSGGGITSFNSNGFTAQRNTTYNQNNVNGWNYIGWQWKAGGTGVTNNSGTITSTVSANPTAGFSIVTYTGSGALATVGHGLGVAPNMIIWKNRSAVQNWVTYHSSLGASGNVYLNLTAGYSADSTTQNNTAPTSSVFTVATSGAVNGSTNNLVAYCFAAVSGYSAFGSYNGSGSADGPFIFTGFKPRFVMVKSYSGGTGDWEVRDTSRDSYNSSISARLFGNSSAAEDTSGFGIDILSNGFKCRSTGTNSNGSGYSYIYAAFAEHPLKFSRAR